MKAYDDNEDGQAARSQRAEASESSHPDLGESEDVSPSHTTDEHQDDLGESADVGATSANVLTSRAQEAAHHSTVSRQKATMLSRAKQIAAKVKHLVRKQQVLEKHAGQKVKGSVLDQAVEVHDREAASAARDTLLAHKLEDEQAMHTMQHLIETERHEQHKAFDKERSLTHGLLLSVRKKLRTEQDKMLKQVRAETTDSVLKVEKELSRTALASTIQKVVKKKLAKRVAELKAIGEKTVHDVRSQVLKLKHRVRRLRREQERMKVAEATMEQKARMSTLGEAQHHRDLGESAGVSAYMNPLTMEMERMRMEQM